MSYRKLDIKGKPIPRNSRSIRKPAERMVGGVPHYHYEIFVTIKQQDGKSREIRKRFWLADDQAAENKQRELKHQAPVNALSWIDAHAKWLEDNRADFSPGHIATSENTIKLWTEDFGADSTVEGTGLAEFTQWITEKAKEGTGRAAQIKREHLLAIARWCRERGLVTAIPFEFSPKPKARTKKRRSAAIEEFHAYAALLPESMRHLWWMLGLTGARLTAICELKDKDITDTEFTVLTKFREYVTYPITDDIAQVIADARQFKADREIESPYLFTKDSGRPWKKDYFSFCLHKVANAENARRKAEAEKVGGEGAPFTALPIITAHQLRHMVGTVGAEEGLSVDQLQAVLAQKSRQSSEDYVDKTQKMRAKGLSVVGSVIKRVGNLSEKYDISANQARNDIEEARAEETDIEAIWRVVRCPHCHRNHIIAKE